MFSQKKNCILFRTCTSHIAISHFRILYVFIMRVVVKINKSKEEGSCQTSDWSNTRIFYHSQSLMISPTYRCQIAS